MVCINPIVPFDAELAASRRGGPRMNLVEGGLPAVLSQTFRAIIHSRMAVGLSKYKTQYRGSDVVLFQPESDDGTVFFTNVFSYAARQQVCEHAYERTRSDLLRRRQLAPLFARHGIRLRLDILQDPHRRLDVNLRRRRGGKLNAAADELRDTLRDLRRAIA